MENNIVIFHRQTKRTPDQIRDDLDDILAEASNLANISSRVLSGAYRYPIGSKRHAAQTDKKP